MGDLIYHEIFRKLNIDQNNQWIFYDECFQLFFSQLTDSITDENILTELELLDHDDMQNKNEILPKEEREAKLTILREEYPGLLESTTRDVEKISIEVKQLEEIEGKYSKLINSMEISKAKYGPNINKLESSINDMETSEKSLTTDCMEICEHLQDLQKETRQLCIESRNCYRKMQIPPLFVRQLALDKYFQESESFLHSLNLYMKENFRIEEYLELEGNEMRNKEISEELETIRKLNLDLQEKIIKEKAKAAANQKLIASVDVNKVHVCTVADMIKETHELKNRNDHIITNTHPTIINNLKIHLEQLAQQQVDLILYENTKERLGRARQKLENIKLLEKIVSEALINAEILWIVAQLDLERARNRFDNSDDLNLQAHLCLRRIEAMKNLQKTPSNTLSEMLLSGMADVISRRTSSKTLIDSKSCLYEYEKHYRLSKTSLKALISKKHYSQVLDFIKEMNRIEMTLTPYVFDGPVKSPTFEPIELLMPILKAKSKKSRCEMEVRKLRSQFQEDIQQRMVDDRYWHYGQVLWIWFLAEPQKLLDAIAEVRKLASKVPLTGVKSLPGIKRMGD